MPTKTDKKDTYLLQKATKTIFTYQHRDPAPYFLGWEYQIVAKGIIATEQRAPVKRNR